MQDQNQVNEEAEPEEVYRGIPEYTEGYREEWDPIAETEDAIENFRREFEESMSW